MTASRVTGAASGTANRPAATAVTRTATGGVPPLSERARDLLAAEWIKLWSVRSTYWTLLVAVVTPIGLSVLVATVFAAGPAGGGAATGGAPASGPGTGGSGPADPMLPGFLSLEYAVLAVAVLGVLAFTAEHTSGLIRTTFTAVPHRRAVLAAKAAVTGGVTLVAGEAVAFVSFLLSQAVLSGHHRGVSLTHPGVPGAVLAEGTLLAACALVGLAAGAVLRHTAGAIAATVGVILLPAALALLPAPWNDRIGRYTLLYAAQQVTSLHPRPDLLAPWACMLVLIAWPAATLLIAVLLIGSRDE